jgi:hypothetical protein
MDSNEKEVFLLRYYHHFSVISPTCLFFSASQTRLIGVETLDLRNPLGCAEKRHCIIQWVQTVDEPDVA